MLTADEFTLAYDFDDIGIEIAGVTIGSFSGTAHLSEDAHGEFYVADIVLDGTAPKHVNQRFDLSWTVNAPAKLSLRDSREAEAQWLFGKLKAIIENSRDAQEEWAEAYQERAA